MAYAQPEQVLAVNGQDLSALYTSNYARLVRIATLLLGDAGAAEEVVQEAFVRVLRRSGSLREPDHASAYVTKIVVNLARSRLRRRAVSARWSARDTARADQPPVGEVDQPSIVQALRHLPARQRQAVVLRYYAQFTETEAAEAMGVSVGAVRGYVARGASRLREELKEIP